MKSQDSIKRRLQRVILLTTGSIIAAACAVFILFEWRNSLAIEKQAVSSIARITADESSATVASGNRAEAQKLLGAFHTEPDVLAAALYDGTGHLIAEYQTPGADRPTPLSPQPDGLYVENARILTFEPVSDGGRRLGALYLQTDLRDMYGRMARYGSIALLMFAAGLAGAYFIGRTLQQTISGPILSLAGTAEMISRQHDYSVRAERATGGEFEMLTTAFNQMLEQIQQQQDVLSQEKELLATTLGSIGDGVVVTDREGRVTFLNSEAERLTGWRSSEAAGRPLSEIFRIVNEHTRQAVQNPVEKVLQFGKVVGLANHTLLLAKDGREVPIDDSAAAIQPPTGPIFGAVLVFRDVTEQRKAQETKAKLAAIVEYSGDAIATKNLDGIIQTWNASAEHLFGYKPDEIVGKSVLCLIPPELHDQEKEILGRIRQGQPYERLETIRLAKDGRRIPVSVTVSPLRNADGTVIGASKLLHDITTVVAAREALAREKELLATTLASIGDAVIVTDAEGRVTFLNSEAERLTGWKSSEAAARPLVEVFRIVNEETRQPVEDPVQKVLRLGRVVGLANHTILLSRNDKEVPIDDSAAPIRQSDGPLFGVVLVFRDFTEHKATEKQLHELSLVPAQSPAPIMRVSRQERLLYANPAALEKLRVWNLAIGSIAPGQARALASEVLKQNQPVERELTVHERSYVVSVVPISEAGYANLYWTDVTERKRAEEALRAREAELESIINRTPFMLTRCSRDLRYRFVSQAYADMLGQQPSDIAGKLIREVMGDEGFSTVLPHIQKVLQGESVTYESDVHFHGIGPRFLHVAYTPDRDEQGNISGWVASILDITERRRAEVELAKAKADLELANQELEKRVEQRTAKLQEMVSELQHVSYAITHDMRAPLRAMSTFASAVQEEVSVAGQFSPEISDYCRRIITAASRLDRLIQDSLNYTKAVLQDVPLKPVDLGKLIPSLIETYPNLQPDQAEITIAEPLPVVLGEESLLTQCFSNLLGNAVKFVPPGVRPRVRVRTQVDGEFAKITIEDNGIGIPANAQSRLFGMFQRLTADYEGTGIGLAIVRKVAERMGGRVGAEPGPGQGSRFWVELRTAPLGNNEPKQGSPSVSGS